MRRGFWSLLMKQILTEERLHNMGSGMTLTSYSLVQEYNKIVPPTSYRYGENFGFYMLRVTAST